MKDTWLKKILSISAIAIAIIALSLWVHRPKTPQSPPLIETKYPLADYHFIPPQKPPPPPPQTPLDYADLKTQLREATTRIQQLQEELDRKISASESLPSSPPPQEDTQRSDLLATRIQAFESDHVEKMQENITEGFDNLKAKDTATHENRLFRTITADKMIPAFLITPISSKLAGKAIAQVESDVFASMGNIILIPKGSKVIGYYNNTNKVGEYRLDIVWTRIITPKGVNIMLTNAKGADIKGYSGLVGEMMTHNLQRYGLPLLVSTLSNGLLIALTSAIADKTGKNNFFGDYLLMQMTRQTGMGLNQIVAQILRDKSQLNPVIVIREGSRVFISPNLDIFFPPPKEGEIKVEVVDTAK
ncbi:DNA type IV secretion system protein ComB10 [Helicobacter cynogastricus]|uniref:DNA type IV secretion system protein ComB10 n=1 Tax=Helicobacter cynogastricus TaxID=329937 RepID=UPI0018F7FDFD|nr:DNA type IV secretion system protein ComB10 [Helicobacter cynogastricus]